MVSRGGIFVDPAKIEAIIIWPVPKTLKAWRGFLGLAGYYRKFIKDFGTLVSPLTELTKKDSFVWTEAAQEAFEKMKLVLSTPVLAMPDYDKVFVIECDAPEVG